ncbi:deoxyribodipyrimidine photolyase [Streptomonospora alba]|uniref:Deoxyribodipyrimidine photolyase n=1 Tax=Streptomonospora alba TaxID=183763 RepID=A0A0C2FKH1_9ACTN|nr:deoxyribodipyrimidine photo-lyase [Streptomonospora alba]KIH99829.1 deoxyribodipyrimidine photolyase [Streptomonospora alba]
MPTTVVLFTRDLRVRDHPALSAAAARSDAILPLFVLDPAVLGRSARNRIAYLRHALADLRASLRRRGADLVVRQGDTVTETLRAAAEARAEAVFLSEDVSLTARQRVRRLEGARIEVRTFPGVTVVPPLEITPSGRAHYAVFTPYWRAWERREWRPAVEPPERFALPPGIAPGPLPDQDLDRSGTGSLSPHRLTGGESHARRRLNTWIAEGIADYERYHDALGAAATSRLSADLRFGCLSPLEVASAAGACEGGVPYIRQLAWRDFHHQVTAAFPDIARRDYRPRDARWNDDEGALAAWREGRTGIPVVDAGMRQLLEEGFMHNRARLITAAFLTRELRIHWRRGGDHFHRLLLDGDVADNYGNWQWVAGTGNDTRPNRRFNLLRQARRFDPQGDYVRRHVPELARLDAADVHTPWRLERTPPGYPAPLVEIEGGVSRPR